MFGFFYYLLPAKSRKAPPKPNVVMIEAAIAHLMLRRLAKCPKWYFSNTFLELFEQGKRRRGIKIEGSQVPSICCASNSTSGRNLFPCSRARLEETLQLCGNHIISRLRTFGHSQKTGVFEKCLPIQPRHLESMPEYRIHL